MIPLVGRSVEGVPVSLWVLCPLSICVLGTSWVEKWQLFMDSVGSLELEDLWLTPGSNVSTVMAVAPSSHLSEWLVTY